MSLSSATDLAAHDRAHSKKNHSPRVRRVREMPNAVLQCTARFGDTGGDAKVEHDEAELVSSLSVVTRSDAAKITTVGRPARKANVIQNSRRGRGGCVAGASLSFADIRSTRDEVRLGGSRSPHTHRGRTPFIGPSPSPKSHFGDPRDDVKLEYDGVNLYRPRL